MRKVLITDHLHPLLKEGLTADGFTVDEHPEITEAQVMDIIQDYEGLVINSKVYAGEELLAKAVKLKFVCRAGSGLEVIDTVYAGSKNIAAFNSPEGNRNAVAEQALGMLLALMNNIVKANSEINNGQWIREENRGYELAGRTVGLIAYGNTAQAFAKLLCSFNVRVLAYDKYYNGFGSSYATEASLEEIFTHADVLSLHLPLTAETTYIIDEVFLRRFKKPIWLINTSRGKVLQTKALLPLLAEGKIRGVALDVLENEKLSSYNTDEKALLDKLIKDSRVILSPHIAGWTHESKRRIAEVLLAKIRTLYAG